MPHEPARLDDPAGSDSIAVPPAWHPDDADYEAHVIRAFIRDGRLASIPARDRKKHVIYRYLLERVLPDPDETVQERDLNMRLALWYPDVATIRRGLIDLGLASRDGMAYRRSVPRR
ncbi:MAG: DUF2087 domain-containing protein [Chloroflexota bacterium]